MEQGQGSTGLDRVNNRLRCIFDFFKGSKRKKRRKSTKLVESPQKGSNLSKDGKVEKRGMEFRIIAHVQLPICTQKNILTSEDQVMKVVVAPWSFSAVEAKEKLERLRHYQPRMDNSLLPFGDVEGLWDRCRGAAWLKYMPTKREEERLERLFDGDQKYAQATELNAIFGRGKYRCKCGMGPERWNSYMERERGFVKEHVSMLKEHWGRNFYNKCSKFVADDPDITKCTDSRIVRAKNVVNSQKMPVLNVGVDINTIKQQSHGEGLRAKHCISKRPKTAHGEMHDLCDNDGDFRIGVRPFSS